MSARANHELPTLVPFGPTMLSRFEAYRAVESKAFRLRVVFGPTGAIQHVTISWRDRLGSSQAFVSFVTRGSRTSRR